MENRDELIQSLLDSSLKKHNGVGITSAIHWPNKELVTFSSGMSDPEHSVEMSSDMLFCLCSINKTMIASVILKLVEQGKLNLDDKLPHWLSDYPQFDERITIRDLLNHTSGLWDFVDHPECMTRKGLPSADLTRLWTAHDILTDFSFDKIYCNPGEGCYYSSTNVILLGLIIEKITQMPLHKALKSFVLDPVGLKNIHIIHDDNFPKELNIACPWYDFSGDGKPINMHSKPLTAYHTLPVLSVYSNAEDIVKWFNHLFHGKIISEKSLHQMLQTRPELNEDWCDEYGLGIAKFNLIPDLDIYGHAGSYFGYMALVIHVPNLDLTVSLLTNDSHGALAQIGYEILPAIFEKALAMK
ncbi:MAG: beta-lactamase family protein [Asgard group archaeon]|nr:beta-lactamase family protein [Asgard group archaeon]